MEMHESNLNFNPASYDNAHHQQQQQNRLIRERERRANMDSTQAAQRRERLRRNYYQRIQRQRNEVITAQRARIRIAWQTPQLVPTDESLQSSNIMPQRNTQVLHQGSNISDQLVGESRATQQSRSTHMRHGGRNLVKANSIFIASTSTASDCASNDCNESLPSNNCIPQWQAQVPYQYRNISNQLLSEDRASQRPRLTHIRQFARHLGNEDSKFINATSIATASANDAVLGIGADEIPDEYNIRSISSNGNIIDNSSRSEGEPFGDADQEDVNMGATDSLRSSDIVARTDEIGGNNEYLSADVVPVQGTDKGKVKVRVTRMWESVQWNNNDILSKDFLLLDSQGTHVHAKLESKNFKAFDQFAKRCVMEEGKIYLIERFDVMLATTYRPVVHPFVIHLKPQTLIESVNEEGTEIARHKFNFVDFKNLQERAKRKTLLSDVIGVLIKVGNSKEKSVSHLREIVIMDKNGTEITIALWGDLAKSIPVDIMTEHNVIIIATSLNAKDYQDKITLSSLSGTKIYINLEIDVVDEYKRSIRGQNFSVQVEGQTINLSEEELLRNRRVTITELKELGRAESENGSSYTCSAIVDKVYSVNWFYNCCRRCKITIPQNESDKPCSKCKVDTEKRYKLRMCVNDFSDITTFVAFNKHAEDLLMKSVAELDLIQKANGHDAVSRELQKIEGKSYIFQVQINRFSAKETFESFTIDKVYPQETDLDSEVVEKANLLASGKMVRKDGSSYENITEIQPSKKKK